MQKQNELPKTFCPAKWDELILNYQHNYVYSCCKATPIVFFKDYKEVIENQKQNLLNEIQDPSCNYCWAVENNNKPSRRHSYLDKFDHTTFAEYLNVDKPIKTLEINLGNTCNMQCIYCNPKLSSQWEHDVKQKKYPVFTDRFVYEIIDKKTINETAILNLSIIEKEKPSSVVMIGGEPLLNKHFWDITSRLKNIRLSISSNFNCELTVIKKLLELEQTNNLDLDILVSIDCTKSLASYNRYDLKYDQFLENLFYFAENTKAKQIGINSLMTCITILDIENFISFLESLQAKFSSKKIINNFHACVQPKIQSFSTIPNDTKKELLTLLKNYNSKIKLHGIDNIVSYLESTEFDVGLHKQFKLFIEEWELRKQITLPKEIKEKLCL